MNDKDWSAESIMKFDDKNNTDHLQKVTEDEFIKGAVEASSGQVTEEEARAYFKELTADQNVKPGEEPVLTKESLQGLAGTLQGQVQEQNDQIMAENSLMAPEMYAKFDSNGDGNVTKDEFIVGMREKIVNGADSKKLNDSQLGQMYDVMDGDGDASKADGKLGKEVFEKHAPSLQDFLNKVANTPPTQEEKILRMFEKLMFQMMTQGGSSLF